MRGDAQDVNISHSIINALLEQTSAINTLHFTGGEPFFVPEIMLYILSQLKKRCIPLHELEVISNGTVMNTKIVEVLERYHLYIQQYATHQDNKPITLSISTDRYHVGYDPWKAISYYTETLGTTVQVEEQVLGNMPWRIGRAKALPKAAPPLAIEKIAHQIHILNPGENRDCEFWHLFKGLPPSQKIVVCPVLLSATGEITQLSQYIFEYVDEVTRKEFIICNLTDEQCCISQAITIYNQDKPSCRVANRKASMMQSEERESDPLSALKTAVNIWKMQLEGNPKDVERFMASLTPAEKVEVDMIKEVLALVGYAEEQAFVFSQLGFVF
jgi:hypothetical protein